MSATHVISLRIGQKDEVMERESSPDLQDYWNEFRVIEESLNHTLEEEEPPSLEGVECHEEREWLEAAGLSSVTEPAFLSGREVTEGELGRALRVLSREQADAVRRRVHSLNKTVRQKQRHKYRIRKPDIRDVFRDIEQSWSADSRSRSATPDSLDSEPPSPPSPLRPTDNNHLLLRFNPGLIQRSESRRRVGSSNPVLPPHALFRRSSRSGGDIVASETADGIRMVGYQRIGSVRVRERTKSESDPLILNSLQADSPPNQHSTVCVTRSHDSLFESPRRHSGGSSSPRSDTIGFEELWAGDRLTTTINNNDWCTNWAEENNGSGKTRVDFLAEEDLATLRPLLFLELTALMDKSGVHVGKVKPVKRKRKEDGLLFGLSIATLLERDEQLLGSEPHTVPLIFQKVLGELERRGLSEEGVLRVGGKKQRVEALCSELEREFYTRPDLASHLIASASAHELSTLLKRLLRHLSQPLLTSHLLHLFYQAHGLADCVKALNLLVLLLPTEHRATLYAILTFLNNVVAQQDQNKMSAHNVAMIVAPSFFPPNVLEGKSGLKAELGMAVQCCKVTEVLMGNAEMLWLVPDSLVAQLREVNMSSRKENTCLSPAQHSIGLDTTVLRINAPQFLINSVPLNLDKHSSAGDIVLRIVEMAREAPRCVKSTKRDIKCRALSELAPNGNLSCLLSTGDPDTALQTHFLYEVGGNIRQRRLEPSAKLLTVYRNNPNAEWVIRCDHRNGSHRILRRV